MLELNNKALWLRIQAFARHLVGLTDEDVAVWTKHSIEGRHDMRCPCPNCLRYILYTNIVDALEQWEKGR